jgi:hypothetical protein
MKYVLPVVGNHKVTVRDVVPANALLTSVAIAFPPVPEAFFQTLD